MKYAVPLLALFVGIALLFPELASAQIDSKTTLNSAVTNFIRPLFKMLQFALVVGGVVLGLLSAFQASRGNSGKWMQAGMLLLVAIIAMIPSTVAGLVDPKAADCVKWVEGSATNPGECPMAK